MFRWESRTCLTVHVPFTLTLTRSQSDRDMCKKGLNLEGRRTITPSKIIKGFYLFCSVYSSSVLILHSKRSERTDLLLDPLTRKKILPYSYESSATNTRVRGAEEVTGGWCSYRGRRLPQDGRFPDGDSSCPCHPEGGGGTPCRDSFVGETFCRPLVVVCDFLPKAFVGFVVCFFDLIF